MGAEETFAWIEDETAARAAFPVMRQLRSHLADADEFAAR